jgi:glutamyl-tRNA reductase
MSVTEPWVMAVHAEAVGADERDRIARSVQSGIAGHHAILLSTCHRVELYGFGAMPDLDTRLQVETGEQAVRHLIRVATGLESAIIGEDEVLHQVRDALARARALRSLDGRLQRLFETAIAAGRRARAGRTATSGNLAQRAVAWMQQRSTLVGHTVLIAGAGRMGSSLAHAASLAGADVVVASRDASRANRLAKMYGGRGMDLVGGAELAPKSAGIAVALAGVWHEFQPRQRDLPPVADISAPPSVPAAVRARLNGCFLGIDDLYIRTRPVPRGYIDEADRVVAVKTREYVRWLDGGRQSVGPILPTPSQ